MPLAISDIKREGRAGLFYAYDETHQYTSADEAVSGAKYTCPICGCRMHLTATRSGRRIFARNPKETHRNSLCITIERKGVERTFRDLDPEEFITSLCRTVSRRQKGSEGPDGSGKRGPTVGPIPTEDDKESKLAVFSSLKQIAESGIDFLDPDDTQGSYKVSDFVMTYKYGMTYFTDPDFELGARIVYARFMACDDRDMAILFFMFDTTTKRSVKFRLLFTSKREYQAVRKKFGEYVISENGTTKFQKRFTEQNVLIACDEWRFIGKEDCRMFCFPKEEFCLPCCGMYQAIFTNPKQLYLLSADH